MHVRTVDAEGIAAAFVQARMRAVALPGFPGSIPRLIADGYAVQDRAIALWPDELVGWKVGDIAPERRDAAGDERLVGPVFRRALWHAGAEPTPFPVYSGGFAAVEAEYAFRLAHDAPPERREWSDSQARDIVGAMHVAVETAGSPLATINELGPRVVVSDFGNNAGLILGPEIPGGAHLDPAALTCSMAIDGETVGTGGAARLVGGPLGALAFALGCCARRNLPLRAGMWVTTGATTGIHRIRPGQHAVARFDGLGEIVCRAVPARPASAGAGAP